LRINKFALLLLLAFFYSSNFLINPNFAMGDQLIDPELKTASELQYVTAFTGPSIIFEETDQYVKLNFSTFIIEFYKGSAGYNKIYDGQDNVLVYDDRITLQYFGTGNWKQRGTPTEITWEKVTDYQYVVVRHYDDYVGTTYNVSYVVKSASLMKIRVDLSSGQTDDYRIYWAPSGITYAEYAKTAQNVVFTTDTSMVEEYLSGYVMFDWSDVYQSFGDITATTFEEVANGKKANIYFNIGIINEGQKITLDPSIVGSSTSYYAVGESSWSRDSFYGTGLFWMFYYNGSDYVYRPSPNAGTWSSEVFVTDNSAGTGGDNFAIWYNETCVDYVAGGGVLNGALKYRRGTPNSDETITWLASEQNVLPYAGDNCSYGYVSLSIDSEGCPWVGYRWYNWTGDFYNSNITKSAFNNGIWQTASGFPYQLESQHCAMPFSVPMTDGNVYVIHEQEDGGIVQGRRWNGTDFEEVETVIPTNGPAYSMTAVSDDNDDIHFVYETYGGDIEYNKYTNGSGWGVREIIVSSAGGYPTLSIDKPNNNTLYCFWGNTTYDHICYVKRVNGVWSSEIDWINEETNGLTSGNAIKSFYEDYGGKIGVSYMRNTTSPYEVMYAYLVVGASDASLVGTTTWDWGVGIMGQRGTFKAEGRWWMFYCDDYYNGYCTSTDGVNWGGFTNFTGPDRYNGFDLDVYFDGVYLHYASIDMYETTIYYRKGVPNPDGSISWVADEQVAVTLTGFSAREVSICTDSSGYPMISYRNNTGDSNPPGVSRSSTNDGTWSTATGFPLNVNETMWTSSCQICVIPMTNNKVYAWYTDYNDFWGRIWNGTGWESQEYMNLTDDVDELYAAWGRSLLNDGDDIHLVYLTENAPYNITHIKRTYGSGWGTPTVIQSDVTPDSFPVITLDASEDEAYCFWTGSPKRNYVYYKKYNVTSGVWDGTETEWLHEIDVLYRVGEGYEAVYMLSSSYYDYGGNIGVIWMAYKGSESSYPMSVKFKSLSTNVAPTIGTFQANATVYANKYAFVNGTIVDSNGLTSGSGGSEFINATMELSGNVILKWSGPTNTFSMYQDTNGYCTLDVANSTRTTINSTSYKLSWRIKQAWNYTEGPINVIVTNTKVFDDDDVSGSGSETGLFTFENDIIVYDATYNPSNPEIGQVFQISGNIHYNGSTAIEDGTGVTVYAVRGGVSNSTSTLTSGAFSINVTAPLTDGDYTWNVYATTDSPDVSVQNQSLTITIHPSGTSPPSPPQGTGPDVPLPTSPKLFGSALYLGDVARGQPKQFWLTITWTGVNSIVVKNATISEADWCYILDSFPKSFWRGIGVENGTASILIGMEVPEGAALGDHQISFTFLVEAGDAVSQVPCRVTLSVTTAPSGQSAKELIGILLVCCVGAVFFEAFRRKRKSVR